MQLAALPESYCVAHMYTWMLISPDERCQAMSTAFQSTEDLFKRTPEIQLFNAYS